jgi:hypothetical protein
MLTFGLAGAAGVHDDVDVAVLSEEGVSRSVRARIGRVLDRYGEAALRPLAGTKVGGIEDDGAQGHAIVHGDRHILHTGDPILRRAWLPVSARIGRMARRLGSRLNSGLLRLSIHGRLRMRDAGDQEKPDCRDER